MLIFAVDLFLIDLELVLIFDSLGCLCLMFWSSLYGEMIAF